MIPSATMRAALSDPHLLGKALQGDSWQVWRTLLVAAMGEALTNEERATFKQFTGREREPLRPVSELVTVVGRRGGKSRAMAVLLCYIAGLVSHRAVLCPGETGIALCVSKDQRIAKIILDYCQATLEQSSVLRGLIVNRTQAALELNNGINIEVRPASFRTLRGPTYIVVVADEVAHWFTDVDYANPDVEILNAVRPGLLTTGGPCILASSAYAKQGELWEAYRKNYGANGDPAILVAKGTTRDFHPTLSQAEIDRALERDYARNSAEYLSEFRTDLEGFVPREVVELCVGDFREQLPVKSTTYRCFVDPASGVLNGDSYTAAIAHKRGDQITIDAVREFVAPFSPDAVVKELIAWCKSYGIKRIVGDNYAGEFAKEPFRKGNIDYELAKLHKTELYRDLLPLLNSQSIILPRIDRLIAQICGLERSVKRSGREEITHPTHGHDDLANAVAGVATLARTYSNYSIAAMMDGVDDTPKSEEERNAEWRRQQYVQYCMSGGRIR
jgi:hypothetical protein